MARAVLQIGGTIVGGALGGPVGAAIGGSIGGLVGNLVDPQNLEGPRLEDLRARASTYGKQIPLIYGAQNRLGGNVIWTTGLNEVKKTTGSTLLGTKQTTYSYNASFAVALGEGVMRNLDAVYANGKLIWDRQATIDSLAELASQDIENDEYATQQGEQYELNAYLQGYNPDTLFPESTPWVLAQDVTLGPGGEGLFGCVGSPPECLSATVIRGALFDRLEWFPGTADQPVSPTIDEELDATPAYRGIGYIVFRNLQLQTLGNSIPLIEVVVSGLRTDSVAGVLQDICDRSGLDLYEAVPRGALTQFPLRGYAVSNANSAAAAIVPLMGSFPFDACDHAGAVRFTPRLRGPYATIPLSDMGARRPGDAYRPPLEITRTPDFELPQESSLSYIDPEMAYQVNTQTAIKASGFARTKLAQSVPITFSADEARAVAERSLWEAWLARESVKLSLSLRYDFLQAGDLFAVPVPNTHTLYRINSVDRGDNGIIALTVAREDRLAYEGNTPGSGGFIADQTVSFVAGTLVYAFNSPALVSDENDSGFHFAIDGSSSAWTAGAMYRSADGGGTYDLAADSNDRDITGVTVGTLANGPTDIWDRVNSISVTLFYEGAGLSSLTEDDLLNGLRNLVWVGSADGSRGELIQYADAVLTAPGQYTLSTLLRGRRGTEHATGNHAAGDVCVFIDGTVGSLDYGQSDLNLTRRLKAVSQFQRPEDVFIYSEFVATGERLKPRSPVHGFGERDDADNINLFWTRRNRLFPPALGRGSVPLGELSESYEVEVLVGMTVVRTATANEPSFEYLATTQTADGITPGAAVTFRVYQMSATVGRGWPATFTV